MKILLINETCGIGSHGKICAEQAERFEKEGHVVRIAYGRDFYVPENYKKYAVQIGNKASLYSHVLKTRLFDKHGLGSTGATKKFLKWADEFNPDMVWLHNIHGYYINYELLFNWLKSKPNLQIKWTLHDCWAFTGHCSHYMSINCDKWKTGCYNCPLKREYPKSILLDNSKKNYIKKKEAFTGIKNLEIIVPSNWLADQVKESFLKEYSTTIVHNTIDKTIFKKTSSTFKEDHGIQNKKMILGVANVWNKKKGLEDFCKLANELDNNTYAIVLVGLADKNAPKNIICVPKTNSREELAKIYSAADVFLNLTYEDNYPTVNLEAEACGCKVITYDVGGCRETISNQSILVETGDLNKIYDLLND